MAISSEADKQVYVAIRTGKRTGNSVKITYKDIADKTGLQITMVSSCIRLLVRFGYLERSNHIGIRGQIIGNTYKILRGIE